MADVHEPSVRSYNMSRVKGKNTKPEVQVRKYLHAAGFRYTLHGKYKGKKLPGKPDIILPAYKSIVFVHGCFWHAHKDCKFFRIPDTRSNFWKEKLLGNRLRDTENSIKLEQMGWTVFVVWTCGLKTNEKAEITLNGLTQQLSLQKQ
ncbi:very short patch repair endonuclease [Cryomorphaceae bacterium 1068]|nr:very short patch repair endonuclease [Cryomorphaceae bacterium 1068]